MSFKIINTILFFIFTRLQLFNYLSPRELFPPAQYCASTFSTFRNKIFFNVNGNIYFISKVFRFTLRSLLELSLSGEPKKIVWSTKFIFTERRKLFFSIFSFSFPSDSARGCRAKVWYQTRNTPARLGFAPEDSQPYEPWCRCSCLFPPG